MNYRFIGLFWFFGVSGNTFELSVYRFILVFRGVRKHFLNYRFIGSFWFWKCLETLFRHLFELSVYRFIGSILVCPGV